MRILKHILLSGILLLAGLLWNGIHVKADAEPITIQITIEKAEAEIGEEIETRYNISGGNGEYTKIVYTWQEYSGGSWISGDYVYLSNFKGTVSYVPEKGTKARIYMSVEDSDGRSNYIFSESISIRGAKEYDPITIQVNFDKAETQLEETIEATYSISGGNGEYTKIVYTWQEYSGGSWISGDYIYLSDSDGTISYAPNKGSQARVYMSVEDSDGRNNYIFSERIPLHGAKEYDPISIQVSLKKTEVYLDEEIEAAYAISGGNGEYAKIVYTWQEYSGGSWISGDYTYLSDSEGTVLYVPNKGTQARIYMSVEDSEGRSAYIFSNPASIVPIKIMLDDRPSHLRIGEEFTLSPYINTGQQKIFLYESSNPNIVFVNEQGIMTAIAEGSATITIRGESTGLSLEFQCYAISQDTPELIAALSSPKYSATFTSGGSQTQLTFDLSVYGGKEPYTFRYILLRDGIEIYSTESRDLDFSVVGAWLNTPGIYTARAIVTDSLGQTNVAFSNGFYEKRTNGMTGGQYLSDIPYMEDLELELGDSRDLSARLLSGAVNSYRWQCSDDEGLTWIDAGDSQIYQVEGTLENNERLFRCILTGIHGEVLVSNTPKAIVTCLIEYQDGFGNPLLTEKKNLGESCIITYYVPEQKGKRFLGWSENVDGTEIGFVAGDLYQKDASIVLYAVWEDVRLPGDVNDDGQVTLMDLVRLCKYLAGYEVDIHAQNSDVNGDGNVTLMDLVRLCKHLAGYNVVLK